MLKLPKMNFTLLTEKPSESPPLGTLPGDIQYEEWFQAYLDWYARRTLYAKNNHFDTGINN